MDTNRVEQLGFKPLAQDLKAIDAVATTPELMRLLARFHERGIAAGFGRSASPDARNSGIYAFYISQGGLGLPDRDYYLAERFAKQKEAYQVHIARMFTLVGDEPARAAKEAGAVVALETSLARNSKSRVELRDPIANYHKFPVGQVLKEHPQLALDSYLAASGLGGLENIIVRQTEFFEFLNGSLKDTALEDWKTYLRWHLLRSTAPYLHVAAEDEAFAFYGKVLRDQQEQEPRWQRAARMIDGEIGEALGQLFVEKYFPPAARARMQELVKNIKTVFRERLQKLDWMADATRTQALAKFDRFTQKIGYPEKFRDYSSVEIRPDDLLGNVQRAEAFETKRQLARIAKPVDRAEWRMTPQTVNAYFNASQNEIVFPAGILQPPFFDPQLDDAVNYGAIGAVIGHEITHGYDDQGRRFDADGNLNDWWTEADAAEFRRRAEEVVRQYSEVEALPGAHINGELTLGENIADFGGLSLAYEALQRRLRREPSRRQTIDGFTPEQRFFLSWAQVWRQNCREEELRRRLTIDPHAPGRYRVEVPLANLAAFHEAFGRPPSSADPRPPPATTIW